MCMYCKIRMATASVAAGVVALGGALTMSGASAEPPKQPAAVQPAKAEKAKVGQAAPAFSLVDTEGKTYSLGDLKGKIVVLHWFSAECPYVVKHYKVNPTFATLNTEFKDKNVVFLAINSNGDGMPGGGKENSVQAKKDWNIEFPILLDTDGAVGKSYGAKNTPACAIISADGTLVYWGAVDNNPDAMKAGDVNYLRQGIEELLKGSTVSVPETKPYGCGVKYAK